MIRFARLAIVVAVLSGCIRGSGDVKEIGVAGTPVAFNVDGAPTVEFNVPDMMCPTSCVAKTREILSQQPGAKEVLVDFDTKTAVVAIEADQFDASQAIAALVDHGFDHSTVKSEVSTKSAAAIATPGDGAEEAATSRHSG